MQKNKYSKFIRLLNAPEREIPAHKIIRVILDTYDTHKTPEVHRWLDRHSRRAFHIIPISSS